MKIGVKPGLQFVAPLSLAWWVGMSVIVSTVSASEEASEPISFRRDVMAVLSKAGCNAGSCHGNAGGKGGFKLSLRGEDAAADYRALTRDMLARRVDGLDPERSLILLKATTQVGHQGGERFAKDSEPYQLLRQWIAQGVADDGDRAPRVLRLTVEPARRIVFEPDRSVAMRVRAVYSNGETRDVTSMAVYEPSSPTIQVSAEGVVSTEWPQESTVIVRYLDKQVPARYAFRRASPDFVWADPPAQNHIDEAVFAKLQALRMNPSALCRDEVFVRRAYLDLCGRLPSASEARAFVADPSSEKRSQLVEALLETPEFADFWALKWADLLRNEEKALDRKGVQAFHRWIRQSIRTHQPMDQFVRDLLRARGSTYQNPAANFFRSMRDPLTRAESSAQLFLGTRLQCAKCHNHPFDRWTQADYYDWANLFSRVQYKVLENNRRDDLDKHEFVGEQVVWMAREGSVTNPKTGRSAASRFLNMSGMDPMPGAEGELPEAPGGEEDPLLALAEWITSPENPLFARVQVNRIWYHLMGRGIVDPMDDFRPTNPPSHPEMLDALTREFVAGGFDMRQVIRRIMNSNVYQLSSAPNETNADDRMNYSHVLARRLSAEQLLDAIGDVTGVSPSFAGYPDGLRSVQIPGARAARARERRTETGDQFLRLFGKPERLLTCECERSEETTMSQAFQLMSGPLVRDQLARSDNRLGQWLASGNSAETVLNELYWTALSRPPTAEEHRTALAWVEQAEEPRAAWEDLMWAALNSKEFILRH